jgi:hypothetical protein
MQTQPRTIGCTIDACGMYAWCIGAITCACYACGCTYTRLMHSTYWSVAIQFGRIYANAKRLYTYQRRTDEAGLTDEEGPSACIQTNATCCHLCLCSRGCLWESSFSQLEAHPPPKEEMDVFSRNTHSVAFITRIREFPRWVRRPAV